MYGFGQVETANKAKLARLEVFVTLGIIGNSEGQFSCGSSLSVHSYHGGVLKSSYCQPAQCQVVYK